MSANLLISNAKMRYDFLVAPTNLQKDAKNTLTSNRKACNNIARNNEHVLVNKRARARFKLVVVPAIHYNKKCK